MVFLFLSEFSMFVKVKTSTEMLVDNNAGSDKFIINVDMVIHKFPCSLISVDAQDIMGSHSINVHGRIHKNKLDKKGKIIGEFLEIVLAGDDVKMPDYDEVKKAVENEEGCHVTGSLEVLKVPGNFHISTHAYGQIIAKLISDGFQINDLSHTINHVSFGDESHIQFIKNNFDVGILNPIDGTHKTAGAKKQTSYEYYLKVVPTTYLTLNGDNYHVHQFTANTNENTNHIMVPSIYFRYDISPILVRVVQYKQPFSHFFIQICAIVGGMFTVIGILDHLFYKLLGSSKKSN
jgi:hypothetical protein